MVGILLFSVIGIFIAMLFLNVYFRVKVMKSYRIMVQNEVDLQTRHFMNKEKLEKELIPKYPHLAKEIRTFVSHIQYSTRMATVLLALITLFGGILMYYR
ncbi:MAG: hypothetical protein AB8G22_23970 [Saprospiraceae bacterium]